MKYHEAWKQREAELGRSEQLQVEADPSFPGIDWLAEQDKFDRNYFGIYFGMQNKRMREKIVGGEALDLSKNPVTSQGDYILNIFAPDKDYCDAAKEAWIWSIGRHHKSGLILASTTTKFYQNPHYECLFLR